MADDFLFSLLLHAKDEDVAKVLPPSELLTFQRSKHQQKGGKGGFGKGKRKSKGGYGKGKGGKGLHSMLEQCGLPQNNPQQDEGDWSNWDGGFGDMSSMSPRQDWSYGFRGVGSLTYGKNNIVYAA